MYIPDQLIRREEYFRALGIIPKEEEKPGEELEVKPEMGEVEKKQEETVEEVKPEVKVEAETVKVESMEVHVEAADLDDDDVADDDLVKEVGDQEMKPVQTIRRRRRKKDVET